MRQILFSIGDFHIYGYGFMIALGFVMACVLISRQAKRYGMNPDYAYTLALICLITGAIGTKLLYWITVLPDFISRPLYYLQTITNGFVIYGGLIIGLICGVIYLKVKKQNPLAYFDIGVPSVALGQAFGRIGCFLAGCCYGKETTSAFSVIFPEGSRAPSGVRLIPTQPIMSALDFLHCAFLCLYLAKAKNRKNGQVLGLYLICYSIGRFLVEFIRGDAERGAVGILSTSQFVSIFILIIGLLFFLVPIVLKAKPAVSANEAAPDDDGDDDDDDADGADDNAEA